MDGVVVWQKKTPNICLGSMICYLFIFLVPTVQYLVDNW